MIRRLLPIHYAGRNFEVLQYTGDLWRGDRDPFEVGSLASQNYAGAEIKYFATQHHEVESYAQRRGMPHVKRWHVEAPLTLIDMFHPSTRANVLAMIREQANNNVVQGNRAAINMAFPVAKNSSGKNFVYRVSTADTAKIGDDIFLKALCRLLPFAHGYYSPAQKSSSNGVVPSFHSEVGLCHRGLEHLRLMAVRREGPPPAPNNNARRRTARNRRNRNRSRSRNRLDAAAAPRMFNGAHNFAMRGPGIFNAANNNAGFVMPSPRGPGIFNAAHNNAGFVMPSPRGPSMFNAANNNAGFVMPPPIGRRFTLNNNNAEMPL